MKVCIAEFRTWFWIDTSDIESLIDAVGAHDWLIVSSYCRVHPNYIEEEWNERRHDSEKAKWKERRIDSKNAKMIAKELEDWGTEDLYLRHEGALGEVHDDYDPDVQSERLTRAVNADRNYPDYDFATLIYYKFLDILFVDLDDALEYAASKSFAMRPGIPKDIARRLRALSELGNVALAEADQPPAVDNNSAVPQPPSSLLIVKKHIAKVVDESDCGRKTREENSEVLAWITYWRAISQKNKEDTEKEIAENLKQAGASNAVIGYLGVLTI